MSPDHALFRRVKYYILFITLILDIYYSNAVLNHLSLWSWILQLLYFELNLTTTTTTTTTTTATNGLNDDVTSFLVRLLHGPSFMGSFALMNMYFWALIANPQMEFDLAPEGRATWLVYFRAAWLHILPVIFHLDDLYNSNKQDNETDKKDESIFTPHYQTLSTASTSIRYFMEFWACVGGYFAMGLTWEAWAGGVNAGAETYKVTIVSGETFQLIAKIIGVLSCLGSYLFLFRPKIFTFLQTSSSSSTEKKQK